MRVMPFHQAVSSVEWGEPVAMLRGEVHPAGPVPGWDYVTPMTVACAVTLDRKAFHEETGVAPEDTLTLIQVDCPSTGHRTIGQSIPQGGRIQVRVEIPAGCVADQIEVRQCLVLRTDLPPLSRRARLVGSRLHQPSSVHRFVLEGSGGIFPTEAFGFGAASLPKGALWLLQFEPDLLDEPFLSNVRLFVNTDHERSADLLANSPAISSVLLTGILQEMLNAVAMSDFDDETAFAANSVGQTLEDLCGSYFGQPLSECVKQLRTNQASFNARLQEKTRFLVWSV